MLLDADWLRSSIIRVLFPRSIVRWRVRSDWQPWGSRCLGIPLGTGNIPCGWWFGADSWRSSRTIFPTRYYRNAHLDLRWNSAPNWSSPQIHLWPSIFIARSCTSSFCSIWVSLSRPHTSPWSSWPTSNTAYQFLQLQIFISVLPKSQHLHQLHTHLVILELADRYQHLPQLVGVVQLVTVREGSHQIASHHSQAHSQTVIWVFAWHRNSIL